MIYIEVYLMIGILLTLPILSWIEELDPHVWKLASATLLLWPVVVIGMVVHWKDTE